MKNKPLPSGKTRNPRIYALAVLITIISGLASRQLPDGLPAILGKYPGDALWALMVFLAWASLLSRCSTRHVAVLSLLTAFSIEALKLNQTPWLVDIRHTTLGHLIFGHVFSWQNMLAYSVGIILGIVLDRWLISDSAVSGS